MQVILGLGSNLGDRILFLSQAIKKLGKFLTNIQASSIYESKALLSKDASPEYDIDYLNLVIYADCSLEPQQLLEHIKQIEQSVGRKERKDIWAPREIDIDILFYGNKKISSENLVIPHTQILNRNFVVIPIAEILPNYICTIEGKYFGKTMLEVASDLFAYPKLPNNLKLTNLCLE